MSGQMNANQTAEPPGETESETEIAARFDAEVKESTRATAISAAAVAVFAYPTWTIFDYLVEPGNASDFLVVRLISTIPILLCGLTLLFTTWGKRHPEVLMLGVTIAVNLGIALMITRLDGHYAAYALGLSLTVYAGAFLLVWPPRYMAALCLSTLGVLTAVLLLADPIGADAVATVYFYIVTACALSFLGQLHRQRAAWSEFQSRVALEREQERSSELVRELDRLSREDPLTGLGNRRTWDEALARECARSGRHGDEFAVLLCDLDQLKDINDRLGHPVGDAVLRALARLLDERAREGDVVARIGGDEFAVLTIGCGLLAATELAEELRSSVSTQATAAAGLGGVTMSIGVAEWEGEDDHPETIMLRADRRLYTAKATRNVVCAGDTARSV
jgi:diguanylate cyclase (GGDEF)-like protein